MAAAELTRLADGCLATEGSRQPPGGYFGGAARTDLNTAHAAIRLSDDSELLEFVKRCPSERRAPLGDRWLTSGASPALQVPI